MCFMKAFKTLLASKMMNLCTLQVEYLCKLPGLHRSELEVSNICMSVWIKLLVKTLIKLPLKPPSLNHEMLTATRQF